MTSAYHRKCKINSRWPSTHGNNRTDFQCTKGHVLDKLTLEQFDKISVKLQNRITNNTRVPRCRSELRSANGPCEIHVFAQDPSFFPRGSDTYITSFYETDSVVEKAKEKQLTGRIASFTQKNKTNEGMYKRTTK